MIAPEEGQTLGKHQARCDGIGYGLMQIPLFQQGGKGAFLQARNRAFGFSVDVLSDFSPSCKAVTHGYRSLRGISLVLCRVKLRVRIEYFGWSKSKAKPKRRDIVLVSHCIFRS
jgi:hypothetical protein